MLLQGICNNFVLFLFQINHNNSKPTNSKRNIYIPWNWDEPFNHPPPHANFWEPLLFRGGSLVDSVNVHQRRTEDPHGWYPPLLPKILLLVSVCQCFVHIFKILSQKMSSTFIQIHTECLANKATRRNGRQHSLLLSNRREKPALGRRLRGTDRRKADQRSK